MKLAEFNKLKKNCPWYYKGTSFAYSESCWAVQESKKLDVACKKRFGIKCCKKNCAVLYWLNRI